MRCIAIKFFLMALSRIHTHQQPNPNFLHGNAVASTWLPLYPMRGVLTSEGLLRPSEEHLLQL